MSKYDTWECARCGGRFGVTEPMHQCYQRPYTCQSARDCEDTAFCGSEGVCMKASPPPPNAGVPVVDGRAERDRQRRAETAAKEPE